MDVEWWVQVGKDFSESLKSLNIGDICWHQVRVAAGSKIKGKLVGVQSQMLHCCFTSTVNI